MRVTNVTTSDDELNTAFADITLFFVLEIISQANNKVLQLQKLIRVYADAHFGPRPRINFYSRLLFS